MADVESAAEPLAPRRRLLWGLLPRGDTLPSEVWARRHAFLVSLLALHAAVLPIVGIAGGNGVSHSVLEGALVPSGAALAAMLPLPGGRKTRAAAAATGLLTCSGLVVHFSGGYIEAHFHFFVMMVILGLYEDWLPFGLAFSYVFFHHGVLGTFSPESVYNHPGAIAHPWRWAGIHAAAISSAALLSIASWRLNEELRATLRLREAQLEASNAELEEANRELRQLDELKTDFISTASHELKTPLTSVVGFAKTVLARWGELDDERRRGLVAVIDEQGERLVRLVNDLLDLSRLEAGAMRVEARRVELCKLLDTVALAAAQEIRIRCTPELAVRADPRHVERILANYVENALKYGRPPVRIDARVVGEDVELLVADHGDGVPAELAPRLFEKFAQAPSSRGRGTGLGLAIVRGLARANGGDAWYGGKNGTTCFAVRLPSA